ncbi:MAG: 50S ribosomal protein L18 [Spirochaetota bacterium]|jgi:large subunit ribosomal protein L18|nr:50S ribosomal protein L18 [Spirochaetota bacterium]
MKRVQEKQNKRRRRKLHVRKHISGTSDRPRLSVFRSSRHMYVQAIDDVNNTTIAAVSTMAGELKDLKNNVENAKKVGMAIGEQLKAKKIKTVVFDRNGYPYHGIVKNIADGAREAGLKF